MSLGLFYEASDADGLTTLFLEPEIEDVSESLNCTMSLGMVEHQNDR